MITIRDQKLITCILPRGTGHGILLRLKQDKGIFAANVNSARGESRSFADKRALGAQLEKDLLNVVVDTQIADEIFSFIHDIAGIGKPHGGLIFVTALKRATRYSLPAHLQDEL